MEDIYVIRYKFKKGKFDLFWISTPKKFKGVVKEDANPNTWYGPYKQKPKRLKLHPGNYLEWFKPEQYIKYRSDVNGMMPHTEEFYDMVLEEIKNENKIKLKEYIDKL